MKEFFESELFEKIKSYSDYLVERFRNIKEPGKPFIIKAFIALITVLATLSIGMMIIEGVKKSPEETTAAPEEETTTLQQIETTAVTDKELKTNLLFGLDNEAGELQLLFLLAIDSEQEKSKILFIDPASVCKVNEIDGDMNYHHQNGGVSQLVLAVSEYTGLEVSRYLVGDDKAFTNLIRYMGDIEVDVKEAVSYNHDGLAYIIDEGKQVMTPDMLLKYFVYLCTDTQKNAEGLRSLFALFAKTLFDSEDSQQAQDNFGSVIGFFETNISALDFSENKTATMKMAHEIMLKMEAYNSLAEFRGPVEQ